VRAASNAASAVFQLTIATSTEVAGVWALTLARNDSLPRVRPLKGLILSGGAGTRLRPITHTSAKQLVPVANKPVLFYGIEALVDAGVMEIGIIIAPETGDEIREAAGDGSQFGAEITYILQDKPAGLAHAVLTAEEFIGDSPFVMYLGDNLLADGLQGLVSTFRAEEPDALILLTPVDDPSSYGVAELDGERVVKLIEKPKDPPSNLALVGVYMFGPVIFDAARALEPSWRGELEITEAIDKLIDDGQKVQSEVVKGWWKDTGQLADMLEANRLVLEDVETRLDGDTDDSRIEGRVVVEKGASVTGSVVRGPAVIGAGAQIEDAYIGPYTSIGENVRICRSEVEHSIVLSGSVVEDLGTRMEASLLGRDVKLTRSDGMPKTLRMLVGDRSEIKLI
jgi:glucose-1-phosphate thymidylyltransferase